MNKLSVYHRQQNENKALNLIQYQVYVLMSTMKVLYNQRALI